MGYHPFTEVQSTLVDQLRQSGVVIFKRGDLLTMIIPVDRYFRPATAEIRRDHKELMKRVARFVNSYRKSFSKPKIYVNGYTDTVFSRKTRLELSKQYADTVSSFLWTFGVPENIVQTNGFGAEDRVASDKTPDGAAANRRVEIIIQ